MRTKLVAGNWKMNASKSQATTLITGILAEQDRFNDVEVAVFPPFVYLEHVASLLQGQIVVGAQDVSEHSQGAFTGDVAAPMLADLGMSYVLIGHSERRQLHGETDQVVARKVQAALFVGLKPVLCVGETLTERDAGLAKEVVARQLNVVLEHVGVEGFFNVILAYEPVWAIGTGKTATPEQAQEVHACLRGLLAVASAELAEKVRILYGGSVNQGNAAALFALPDVDGALVGGASLKAQDFIAICCAAQS